MPSQGIEAAAGSRLRAQSTTAGVVVLVAGALGLGTEVTLGAHPSALPVCMALIAALNLLTLGFLVAEFRAGRDPRTLVITWALLWSATLSLGTLVVLPGLSAPGGGLAAVDGLTVLFAARHLGVALLVAVALSEWPVRLSQVAPPANPTRMVATTSAAVVAVGVALVVLMTEQPLPLPHVVQVEDGRLRAVPGFLAAVAAAVVLLLAVAVRGAVRLRLHRRLESWVLLLLLAGAADVLLALLDDRPWTVTWYGARALSVFGAAVVVGALLHEIHRLQTRTRGIAEQLAAQNATLTEAQGLRDHLTAVVSHDMRSPLAGLLGYLEVLERDPTLSPIEVERIHNRSRMLTRRLIMLTEDLLASATIDGPQVLPEEIDLRMQIDHCVAAFPELSVVVRGPACVDVVADPLRLQQILTNLLRNAQKHGAEPVHVHVVKLGAAEVQVSVSDAGPGVPEEFVPQLFERYTRGPGRATHGSGLGLSVARSLAERQGGSLDWDPTTRSFVLVLRQVRQGPGLARIRARRALTPTGGTGPS